MKRLALAVLALPALAAAQPARHLGLQLDCPAVIDADRLAAAIAVELSATAWTLDDTDPEATLTVSATPCEPGAVIRLALTTPARATIQLEPIWLPEPTRARGVALLVADTLGDLAAFAAPAPRPTPPAAPRPAPPSDVDDAVLRRDLGPRPADPPAPRDELALSVLRRSYFAHPDKNATGLRITAARTLPGYLVRAALDLGGDQMSTPYGFDYLAARTGAQVGTRVPITSRLALELGARGELAYGYIRGASSRDVLSPWIWSASVNALLAATFDATRSTTMRLELEVTLADDGEPTELMWRDPLMPDGIDRVEVSSRAIGLALGISVR